MLSDSYTYRLLPGNPDVPSLAVSPSGYSVWGALLMRAGTIRAKMVKQWRATTVPALRISWSPIRSIISKGQRGRLWLNRVSTELRENQTTHSGRKGPYDPQVFRVLAPTGLASLPGGFSRHLAPLGFPPS